MERFTEAQTLDTNSRKLLGYQGIFRFTSGRKGERERERERERGREREREGEMEGGRERGMEGGSLGVHIDLLSSLHSSDEHIAVHVGP